MIIFIKVLYISINRGSRRCWNILLNSGNCRFRISMSSIRVSPHWLRVALTSLSTSLLHGMKWKVMTFRLSQEATEMNEWKDWLDCDNCSWAFSGERQQSWTHTVLHRERYDRWNSIYRITQVMQSPCMHQFWSRCTKRCGIVVFHAIFQYIAILFHCNNCIK